MKYFFFYNSKDKTIMKIKKNQTKKERERKKKGDVGERWWDRQPE